MTAKRAPNWHAALTAAIAEAPKGTVLLWCTAAHPLARSLTPAAGGRPVQRCARLPARLPRTQHQLVVTAGRLEALDRTGQQQALARLRDVLAKRVLVWSTAGSEAGFRALGYRLLARDGRQRLYGYDLYDYKDVPAWLNPEHWANPQNWDRARW